MREVTDEFLSAVAGSNSPVVTVDIWLGGDVVRAGLKPVSGSVEFDGSRTSEGRLSVSLFDEESTSSRLGDNVHAIGMRANVRAGFDMAGTVETVSMGWYDITDVVLTENWEWFEWQDQPAKLGTLVEVEAESLMSVLARSPFLVPKQPAVGAGVWETIADLCQTVGISVLDPGYEVKTVPSGLVFDFDRLDAVQKLAAVWDGAYPVFTDDGQLTLTTDSSGDEVSNFGVRINIAEWKNQSHSYDLRNGVTFLGKSPEGLQLIGTATESDGPAWWGGPFGFRPLRVSSDLMTTQAMVDQAAQTRLVTEIKSRSVTQQVNALWNPAVQLRDRMVLELPDEDVSVQVVAYSLPLTGGPMSVSLRLPVVL